MRNKYLTEEERKEAHREASRRYAQRHKEQMKQYYQANKEKRLEQMKEWREANKEYMKQYRETNREKILEQHKEYNKKYYNTPIGRASNLVNAYNREDKKYNRGKGNLTAKWIVENIFSKSCVHCGESDWRKIGCNRLDNSKPHTMDNVEPCCYDCNVKVSGGRPIKMGLTSPS